MFLCYGFALVLLTHAISSFATAGPPRSFEIDYQNNRFVKDGQPFRYISGSIHYFRVRPEYWRDRLRKLRYAGFNTVQTYTLWASHERQPGVFNFEDGLDLLNFITIAQQEDLLVILRPGPYIDAEIDMGGLPPWLLKNNSRIKLRTNDKTYVKYVHRWLTLLLGKLKPYLYANGGPILMLQIENEYGSYAACDFSHTAYLRDLTRQVLGQKVTLFTTDGDAQSFLKCGKVADVYATVDFGAGSNPETAFGAQRLFEPRGPLINSEFYAGWFDHWGQPHSTVNDMIFSVYLEEMLAMNASVNVYVFHGGTSFGMMSGSNLINDVFMACPTSYDYDAPLNEAGDPTHKYYMIRNITQKFVKLPDGPVPRASQKYAYGKVFLKPKRNILKDLGRRDSTHNRLPLSFEDLSYNNGLVLYQTQIASRLMDPTILSFDKVHDRGYVFVDDQYYGVVSRQQQLYTIGIFAQPNQTLTIAVESQGRICYGDMNDSKGLTTVTLGASVLKNWKMTPIALETASDLLGENEIFQAHPNVSNSAGKMIVYEGFLEIFQPPVDTFLQLSGWTKGYAYINGFLLGRYWPVVGPQQTLYVPGSLLKKGFNQVTLLELEQSPCQTASLCYASFVDKPVIDGPIPQIQAR